MATGPDTGLDKGLDKGFDTGLEAHSQDRPDSDHAAWVASLLERIETRRARIGIVGLGYVGLPLARAVARQGFPVVGFDIDPAKPRQLNEGRSYIAHVESDEIARLVADGRLTATTDFAGIAEMAVVILCVPTPLTRQREPDLRFVESTAEAIAPGLRPGQLIVLESTTYPGTCRDVLRPILERGGRRSGRDFFLAYSPEREDPGNRRFETASIPKVVGGDGPDALRLARALYDAVVVGTVPVSSLETAEAVKLTENIFRSVNIALVNELKVVFDAMGIDVWEVIEAAKTKPFGYMPFYPGPGLGGHCIPIDPFYLTWKAREFGITTRFIELAGQVNTAMPQRVVERTLEAMNQRAARAAKGSHVLLVGLAYKKNVDDTRESPAFRIMELLERAGARVSYHDPLVPVIPETREYAAFAGRPSSGLDPALLASLDAAIVCTDHDAVDYAALVGGCRLVVDTRNALAQRGLSGDNVVKA
ncbi:MAG: nucleotide sugar dehydrogenase [Reyranellaceae bacterium]